MCSHEAYPETQASELENWNKHCECGGWVIMPPRGHTTRWLCFLGENRAHEAFISWSSRSCCGKEWYPLQPQHSLLRTNLSTDCSVGMLLQASTSCSSTSWRCFLSSSSDPIKSRVNKWQDLRPGPLVLKRQTSEILQSAVVKTDGMQLFFHVNHRTTTSLLF